MFFGNNFIKICHSDSSEVRYEQLNQRAAFTMKTRSSFELAATTYLAQLALFFELEFNLNRTFLEQYILKLNKSACKTYI